jgi:hypothetical protein
MNRDYLLEAIRSLKPDSEFSFVNNDYSTIKWDVLNGIAPTQSEIDTAIEQIKADEIAQAEANAAEKVALLARLGLTAEEAKLLLS